MSTKFGKIGLHTLAAYPPANLNRDEDGRPKTAIVGGTERLRVSSQARKRPWRLSDEIAALDAKSSTRTRELGVVVRNHLVAKGVAKNIAEATAKTIAAQFGKLKTGKGSQSEDDAIIAEGNRPFTHEENVVYGFEEWAAIMDLADTVATTNEVPDDDALSSLPRPTVSIDVAMFGRMRAAQPELNVDAAIAVSPLLSTHAVSIEADNWTALDDLNPVGAAGMGEIEFASAIMYGYACIDVDSLAENLKGDLSTARDSISALMRVVALIGPAAMRSRFAQDVLPDLYAIELGPAVYSHQSAFTEAVSGTTVVQDSIERFRAHAERTKETYSLSIRSFELSPELPLDKVTETVLQQVFG